MTGRRERSATHAAVSVRPKRRVVAALVSTAALATTAIAFGMVTAAPAQASAITANVQLASTGLADSNNPVGGSIIGIRPGDSVSFTTAVVPTAGLDSLGLGGLVGGLLGNVVGYQSSADFAKLPGGKSDTTVKTAPAVKFTFPKAGTYKFTWTVDKIVSGLLGNSVSGLDLDGNQLKAAGVKLNADNEYVGQVVVSDNPPKGGLSIQLPSVSVEPSAPVVGQLPKVTIPGVNLPTVSLPSVGDLLPRTSLGGKTSSGLPTTGATSSAQSPYQLPGDTVPEQVVPGGSSGGGYTGNSDGSFTGSGNYAGLVSNAGNTLDARTGTSGGSGTSDGSALGAANAGKTVDLATRTDSASSQLPVVLAILAIIALALVGGTYAKLFLLTKRS